MLRMKSLFKSASYAGFYDDCAPGGGNNRQRDWLVSAMMGSLSGTGPSAGCMNALERLENIPQGACPRKACFKRIPGKISFESLRYRADCQDRTGGRNLIKGTSRG
jgi:hypothetical protein